MAISFFQLEARRLQSCGYGRFVAAASSKIVLLNRKMFWFWNIQLYFNFWTNQIVYLFAEVKQCPKYNQSSFSCFVLENVLSKHILGKFIFMDFLDSNFFRSSEVVKFKMPVSIQQDSKFLLLAFKNGQNFHFGQIWSQKFFRTPFQQNWQ